jgi:hypothetical protein
LFLKPQISNMPSPLVSKNCGCGILVSFISISKTRLLCWYLPPNFMEIMHVWSTFRLMVANPGRLWKMAAIVTKKKKKNYPLKKIIYVLRKTLFGEFFSSFLFFSLIFKFEKWQRPCLMAVEVIIHGLKENYICIVPL